MRLKTWILAAFVSGMFATSTASDASGLPSELSRKDCASYSVTTTPTGTKAGSACVPGGPDSFSVGHYVESCGEIPPIGEADCWAVVVWLPI